MQLDPPFTHTLSTSDGQRIAKPISPFALMNPLYPLVACLQASGMTESAARCSLINTHIHVGVGWLNCSLTVLTVSRPGSYRHFQSSPSESDKAWGESRGEGDRRVRSSRLPTETRAASRFQLNRFGWGVRADFFPAESDPNHCPIVK